MPCLPTTPASVASDCWCQEQWPPAVPGSLTLFNTSALPAPISAPHLPRPRPHQSLYPRDGNTRARPRAHVRRPTAHSQAAAVLVCERIDAALLKVVHCAGGCSSSFSPTFKLKVELGVLSFFSFPCLSNDKEILYCVSAKSRNRKRETWRTSSGSSGKKQAICLH